MRRFLVLWVALVLLPPAPAASQAQLAAAPLWNAVRWVGNHLVGYAFGKTVDRVTGQNVEQDLETLEARLVDRISRGEGDLVSQRQELSLARSELKSVRKIMAGSLTRADLESLRGTLQDQIDQLIALQAQHGQRLNRLEEDVRDLRQQLTLLQATGMPRPDSPADRSRWRPPSADSWSSSWRERYRDRPRLGCPSRPGIQELYFAGSWYGPFEGNDHIQRRPDGGFVVWETGLRDQFDRPGVLLNFPDPHFNWDRNTWTRLVDSCFSVCIASNGQIFAVRN